MVALGVLLLLAALIAGVGVLVMNANTATDETLHVFGYSFGTTPAGGFLIGALVGAVALAGIALIANRLAGAAGRKNASKRLEAERAALTEKHQQELASHRERADEERAALVDEHETELARHRQEAETQRVTLAEQHQRELERQRKEAEAEKAELTRQHEEQLAQGKQAVRDALERALGTPGESDADRAATPDSGTTRGAIGATTAAGGAALASSETPATAAPAIARQDTETDTERSRTESWERAFGDTTDERPAVNAASPRGTDTVAERTDADRTDVEPAGVGRTDVDRTDVAETPDERVEPLGWHREVDAPHEGNGHRVGRHRETEHADGDGAAHKNLWQRVVEKVEEKVEQRRHP